MAFDTCALYGVSNYTNSWIGINLLVILASLVFIAVVYTAGGFAPARMRSRLYAAVRAEYTQILLSAVIIAVLAASAHMVCNVSVNYSMALSHSSLSPFQYADSYVGNLATNKGLALLTNIYSQSIGYDVEGEMIASIVTFTAENSGIGSLRGAMGALGLDTGAAGVLDVTPTLSSMLSWTNMFYSLSGMYISIFATIVTFAVGVTFLQYLLIQVIQATAFTVLLPIAILMRSLAFTGTGLRQAANSLLAIAVAAYLVFPLTVAYNAALMNYVLSTPGTMPSPANLDLNTFFAGQSCNSPFGCLTYSASLTLQSLKGYATFPFPNLVINRAVAIVSSIAQYLFQATVLFAIDLAITIGFAASLAKALNSGIEGVGSFWGSL